MHFGEISCILAYFPVRKKFQVFHEERHTGKSEGTVTVEFANDSTKKDTSSLTNQKNLKIQVFQEEIATGKSQGSATVEFVIGATRKHESVLTIFFW